MTTLRDPPHYPSLERTNTLRAFGAQVMIRWEAAEIRF